MSIFSRLPFSDCMDQSSWSIGYFHHVNVHKTWSSLCWPDPHDKPRPLWATRVPSPLTPLHSVLHSHSLQKSNKKIRSIVLDAWFHLFFSRHVFTGLNCWYKGPYLNQWNGVILEAKRFNFISCFCLWTGLMGRLTCPVSHKCVDTPYGGMCVKRCKCCSFSLSFCWKFTVAHHGEQLRPWCIEATWTTGSFDGSRLQLYFAHNWPFLCDFSGLTRQAG